MKVFISWSGNKSKAVARILGDWIEQVIQAVETWQSVDIEKGQRWNQEINKKLEETKVGIVCLTNENLLSEWIHFEAGAISKTKDAYLCTFLFDIAYPDVKRPLEQFQHTKYEKEDVKKLMSTINGIVKKNKEKALVEKNLDTVFEMFWPELDKKLKEIPKEDTQQPQRSQQDLLEEILQLVRSNSYRGTFPYYLPSPATFLYDNEGNPYLPSFDINQGGIVYPKYTIEIGDEERKDEPEKVSTKKNKRAPNRPK